MTETSTFTSQLRPWDSATEPECRTAGRIDFCHPRYYRPQPALCSATTDRAHSPTLARYAGIAHHLGKGMAAVVADFNGDKRLNLFVTNDKVPAFVFKNVDGSRFEEVAFDAASPCLRTARRCPAWAPMRRILTLTVGRT